ncbi:MAG: hypothetical protein Q8L64_03730 [bacterium]|nr:hypothetical protein [bacterium]
MEFKPTTIKLEKGQVVTSIYHSPFDYNLLYLICLAKTGLKVRIILDDIDNLGVDKSFPEGPYSFSEKFFMSKTERTNIRALSLITPKHLFANLSHPNLKEFDSKIGISTFKENIRYRDTVEHWIRDVTKDFGTFSLIGPDRSYAFTIVDHFFVQAISDAKQQIIDILKKFPDHKDNSIEFIEWLFDEKAISIGTPVSDYFLSVMQKIVDKFDLRDTVSVERMSDSGIEANTKKLMDSFTNKDSLWETYNYAVVIEGKKNTEDFPFYAISKMDGKRLLPTDKYTNDPTSYFLAPKVLMLNNFENLVLPYHAMGSMNVRARQAMYQNKEINCNQIFCDDEWMKHIGSFNIKAQLDTEEQKIYDMDTVNLSSLGDLFAKGKKSYGDSVNTEEAYKGWIITSTFNAIDRVKYPLIFMALLQKEVFPTKIPIFYKLA